VYVHVLRWDGDAVTLPNIPARIVKSEVLTGGTGNVKQSAASVVIAVPPGDRQVLDTIIRLELDKPALEIAPVTQAVL
jgi:hypothetical protein